MLERLQKVMANRGVASRRDCEGFIVAGKVKVNGVVVRELGIKVDPTKDKIEFGNQGLQKKVDLIYVIVNKPDGYICTAEPEPGQKSILELLPKSFDKYRLFPVGRLDKHSEGLVLLTNDGDLAYKMMHPKFEEEKEYYVTVDKRLFDKDLNELSRGVELEEGMTKRCKVKKIDDYNFSITLEQGWNRQIRRMCEAVGYKARRLTRVREGSVELGNLPKGKWKVLQRGDFDK